MDGLYLNPAARSWDGPPAPPAALEFHRSLPGYAPTPLTPVPALAAELGVGSVYVKDESLRFGLPAFKVLGASWACRQALDRSPGVELVTATDGNHGRAVARIASQLGSGSTVFVPALMAPERHRAIEAEGAQVVVVPGDYDEAVRRAATYADDDEARTLVQDTGWQGYEQVPAWIVEGYRTMCVEVDDALPVPPSMVVVPAGVGSLAQAVVGHYRQPRTAHPSVLCVEPVTAAGVLSSLSAGARTTVPTANTAMAGLNCGTVSTLAWPVLRDGCDAAVAVDDDQAITASTDLAGHGISSGNSGAATLAGVRAALADPAAREACGLMGDSVVVLLNTDGR